MSDLSYASAAFLGVLQGATEFLPISSSGHLALAQHFLHLEAESQAMIVFDLAVHLGTLVAVVVVFASDFTAFARRLIAESSDGFTGRRIAWKITGFGVAASIPTAVIGLLFKDELEAAFGKPFWIAWALIFTGTLLWITNKVPRPTRGWRRFGFGRAVLIGLGQGLAIMPGVSRSGTTISLALIVGIKRRWAGQFSFFIAVPAIGGAALLKLKDVLSEQSVDLATVIDGPLIVGSLIAAVTGYVALRALLSIVHRAKLHYFSYYCWVLGVVVLVLASRMQVS